MLFACALSVAATAWVYEHFDLGTVQASSRPVAAEIATATSGTRRTLPAQAMLTILAASFPETDQYARDVRSMTEWLEGSGYPVYYASIDHGADGRWRRVLAGAYTDSDAAAADALRLKAAAPNLDVQVVTSAVARGIDR